MKINAKPGDYVEVHLSKLIYEGVLLKVPDNEKGIFLLKLDSGYNIGFNKKDILNVKLLRSSKEIEEKVDIKKDNEKPNIAMIITGGTIAARLDPSKGGVSPLDSPEKLFKYYPSLFDHVNVSKVEIPFMKFSEDMDFKDWQKIAKSAEKFLNDSNIKGVIITQGTDTLHYTSAALSFFLRNLNKPVVLTFSQRSIDRGSSDANLNLQCSALAAISDIAEVMIVGHGTTNDDYCYGISGTKVRKMHTSKRNAFKAINTKPFAKIFPERIELVSEFNKRDNGKKVKLDIKFEEKVALIKYHPNQNPDILDYYIKKKYKGIVLEVLGLGQIAAKDARNNWLPKIKEAQEKGIFICATAQTIYGRLDPLVYSTGRDLMNSGIVYLGDMLSETAFVKLSWVLGHSEWTKNKEMIKEKMLENISGEFGDKVE